jgi:peptidoglycan hydrolase CwlO-like protein
VTRRSRWCAAIATLLALLGSVAIASPASAGDPVTEARDRLDQAQQEAIAAHNRYENTLAERDQALAEIARIEGEITRLQNEIAALRAFEKALREIVTERAADLYRHQDVLIGVEAFGDFEDAPRRRALARAALDADVEEADRLKQTGDELEKAQQQLDAQRAELDARRAELDATLARLESEKAEFDRKVAAANAALEKAKALDAIAKQGTPVMGASVLSAADLAGWFRSTGSNARLSNGMSIDQLAQLFIEEGAAEQVRGDVAFAQSYLETGGFSFPGGGQVSPSHNNFAGLGACDSCSTGRQFPTARDGIRAQIQHLRNYADETSRAAYLTNPPSPYWYGADPATAARNFDTFFAKGWAPTWEQMGRGKWATDPNYASKVIGLYQRMSSYATAG